MRRLWRNDDAPRELEGALRARRQEPRPEFLQSVVDGLRVERRRPAVKGRLALAAALTVVAGTVFAGFGGIGYAASAGRDTIHVLKGTHSVKASASSSLAAAAKASAAAAGPTSSAAAQYIPPGKQCKKALDAQKKQDIADYKSQQAADLQDFLSVPRTHAEIAAFKKQQRKDFSAFKKAETMSIKDQKRACPTP